MSHSDDAIDVAGLTLIGILIFAIYIAKGTMRLGAYVYSLFAYSIPFHLIYVVLINQLNMLARLMLCNVNFSCCDRSTVADCYGT
ncbi:hypothetical protein BLOT_009211 [Blomia tropicalis]|nr:hypothetical protein BLOT_009211 [Blomia tropicalis]